MADASSFCGLESSLMHQPNMIISGYIFCKYYISIFYNIANIANILCGQELFLCWNSGAFFSEAT